MPRLCLFTALALMGLTACGASKTGNDADKGADSETTQTEAPAFDADSAYAYVKKQVDFGPRVPNTPAHRQTSEWLAAKLKEHGAEVSLQHCTLIAFDGTNLKAVNIIGQYNPEAEDRLLLLAHWDCRPWADEDPDPANRRKPVDGANDGASGVGVLLEVARQLQAQPSGKGVDILFVDAEDYGTEGDDDSWALGTEYFVTNPIRPGYRPTEVILLDMVGAPDASFSREYFSEQANPALTSKLWEVAKQSGYGDLFVDNLGGALTDDHVRFIRHGIPAIDIVDFDATRGFNPTWHTTQDNMDNISPTTLKAVGQTLLNYIYR